MSISENETGYISQDSASHGSVLIADDSSGLKNFSPGDTSILFPYNFTEQNIRSEQESESLIAKTLKEGEPLPERPFHYDWVIIIVLISAFFYASLPAWSRKLFPGATRFFLFRGIRDPESRETSELFHWQSTLFNLVTFVNLALFGFYAFRYHGPDSGSLSPVTMWLIALAVVISAVTLRHLACLVTGRLSGQAEVFNEYLITIYQSYRYTAFGFLAMVCLISYTGMSTPKVFFITGYVLFAMLYLMRIARLLLIFIKLKFSILYWILYLCALEIMPAAIVVKSAALLF